MNRKLIASVLILSCCISVNLPVYATTSASAGNSVEVEGSEDLTEQEISQLRLYGSTRYETAQIISQYYSQGHVNNVLIATGNDFADALSASVFAHELKAPILLVDTMVEKSRDAFAFVSQNLDPQGTIYIIGGEGVIGREFEAAFNDLGFSNVVRVAGEDRYATSYTIASSLKESPFSTVVISSGEQYPDALSISSFAANQGWPILLSPQDKLPEKIKEFFLEKNPEQVYITGGPGAISDQVLAEIRQLLPQVNVERLTGESRFGTNIVLAKTFTPNPSTLYLATGHNFADALAGSVLAAQTGDPIIFIDSIPTLPKATANYLENLYLSNIRPHLITFGGSGVISDDLLQNVRDLLSGVVEPTSIYSIPDINETVPQGKEYSLPSTVPARLYNSDLVEVPVQWEARGIDTGTLGLKTLEGFVAGYDKPVKLNLKVNEPLPIAEYITHFNVNEVNRSENLRLAAKAIDGKRLAPGEGFSFNETVGERTMEAGYKEAVVIEGNAFTLGLGGGICQVSSTLYNAVALAQLEIVERHHHSLTVGYVPPGQDATVAWGVLDFKFRNNTTDDLIIRTSVEGGTLTVRIYKAPR